MHRPAESRVFIRNDVHIRSIIQPSSRSAPPAPVPSPFLPWTCPFRPRNRRGPQRKRVIIIGDAISESRVRFTGWRTYRVAPRKKNSIRLEIRSYRDDRGAFEGRRRFGSGTNKRIKEIERPLDRPIDRLISALSKCLPFAERLRALMRVHARARTTAAHKIIIMVAINRKRTRALRFHSRESPQSRARTCTSVPHLSLSLSLSLSFSRFEGECLPLFPPPIRLTDDSFLRRGASGMTRRTKDDDEAENAPHARSPVHGRVIPRH